MRCEITSHDTAVFIVSVFLSRPRQLCVVDRGAHGMWNNLFSFHTGVSLGDSQVRAGLDRKSVV